jgi:amino acid permease
MATSTLLQKLDPVADGFGATTSHRRQTETFIANGTIAAGDWVAFDTSKTGADRVLNVIAAVGGALGTGLVVGVSLEAAAAGDRVNVVVAGYAEGASVANAVAAAGVALVVDATAAGQAVAIAATDLAPACGVSLEAAGGNVCDVWVYKQF